MGRPSLPALVATVALALVPAGSLLRGDQPLVQVGETFVTADGDRAWTIGNASIKYSIGDAGGSIVALGLVDPVSGKDWNHRNATDGYVSLFGQHLDLGSPTTQFVSATTTEWWGGVRLDLHYIVPAQQFQITRSYACFPSSAVIETWTTYQTTGTQTLTLSDLNNYSLTVPNSTARWVTGVNTPDEAGGAFTRASGDLDDGQVFELGSNTRSAEQQVPWFGIGSDETSEFFGAIMWSGQWHLRLQRVADTIVVQLGLPVFMTSVTRGAPLETPHAVFGFTTSAMPAVSVAMRGFVDHELRHGRSYGSYVTYNTWYSYGTFIDEGSLLAEMDQAAAMGMEQFVVDAGWWPSINANDPNDFSHGWGTYQVDMDRFPDGLSGLSDHAHQLGMRFGVWVEPERVDRNTVGQPGGVTEPLLAMQSGRYDPNATNANALNAQVCFADPQARDWVIGRLDALIDAVHPDYLKWDNNFWVNCDRAGHGHGTQDGNFLHMRGVNQVRDYLRGRYPNMEIEDCSSGANRLSFDMLSYSDLTWVSDETSPSSRVRHNLEGLINIFPAPYLLTFALQSDGEPMTDDPAFDLRTIMRSRMPGVMGFSVLVDGMSDGTKAALTNQFSLYKYIRPIIVSSNGLLLSPQQVDYPGVPWSGWDIIEHISPTTGDAIVMAFDTPDASSSIIVQPKALRTDVTYQVESADYGVLGTIAGADLMAQGIEIDQSDLTHSHIVILHAQVTTPDRR